MPWFSRFLLFLAIGVLFCSGLLFLGGSSLYETPVFDYKTSEEHLLPIDVIVCLAGAKGRIEYATQVWFEYWMLSKVHKDLPVPKLYISGMGEKSNWNVFLSFVPDYIQKVILPEHVVLETKSMNTEENARFFNIYIKEYAWKKVLLITSSYHLKRSVLIFQKELKEGVEIFPHEVAQDSVTKGNWFKSIDGIRMTFIEFLKWIFYRGLYEKKARI